MPPCLVISMISSTGILQLTSYVDTQKSNPSLSKIIEPIKIDIVAVPKIMAPSKDSQTMTATASVTTVSKTTIPTFGSGQPPVPVKAPTAFAGFGTGAASMTSASASVAAVTTVSAAAVTTTSKTTIPTFGSGQPPAPVNAKAVTSISNATPLRSNLGRSVDKDIDAITMDITDVSFDGTASGSNSNYTIPSTPVDKCHYLLLRIQSEVNDFREMYSKNITHDLKTGSVIALAMEANLSSLKLSAEFPRRLS